VISKRVAFETQEISLPVIVSIKNPRSILVKRQSTAWLRFEEGLSSFLLMNDASFSNCSSCPEGVGY
jgi:hypothetical protein